MQIISVDKIWFLKETNHEILYRRAFSLEEEDKIILNLIKVHEGIIIKSRLGLLLGFGTKNISEKDVYKDEAEIQLFEYFLKKLKDFSLIEEVSSQNKEEQSIVLSYWGEWALKHGEKYKFYQGSISIYEHLIPKHGESIGFLFPFHKIIPHFKLAEKTVEFYELKENTSHEDSFFLEKAKFHYQNSLDYNPDVTIDLIEKSKSLGKEYTCELTVHLYSENNKNYIKTACSDILLPELDELLSLPDNKVIYDDLLLFAEFQAIFRDSKKITSNVLSKYRNYVNWGTILEDKRIAWSNQLFQLLTNKGISSGSIWIDVVDNCPEKILKNLLESDYSGYLSWLRLTEVMSIEFIIENYQLFAWDLDTILERVSSSQIESFLLNNELNYHDLDWSVITEKVSDQFIIANINNLDFDLRFITRERQQLHQSLLVKYPEKKWDWYHITNNFDLAFLLGNLGIFSRFINLPYLLERIINDDSVFPQAINNKEFLKLLSDKESSTLKDYKIGSYQKIKLDIDTIPFLDNYDLLMWGDRLIEGVECNENIIWTPELFKIFQHKIQSPIGKNRASKTIDSLETVQLYPDFDWNFKILAGRKEFLNSIKFILIHDDKIPFQPLIKNIPLNLLHDHFEYFYNWSLKVENQTNYIFTLGNRSTFSQILTLIHLHSIYNLPFDWEEIIDKSNENELCKSYLSYQETVLLLENQSRIRLINKITDSLHLSFIKEQDNLLWNWQTITKKKFSHSELKNTNTLIKYADRLDWLYIIEKIFVKEDLVLDTRLEEIATYLTKAQEENRKLAWTAITAKLETYVLWNQIQETFTNSLYKWDWDLISSTDRMRFDFTTLEKFKTNFNWDELSKNPILNRLFKFDRNIFRTHREWLELVLKYLTDFKKEWNFKKLSFIDSITWNYDIIDNFLEDWDWDVLSEQSRLIIKFIKEKKSEQFNFSSLKKYRTKLNWHILSSRYSVQLTHDIINRLKQENWDWQALSKHPYLKPTIEFLAKHQSKQWNWYDLTHNKSVELSGKLLLAKEMKDNKEIELEKYKWVQNKSWDWQYLSTQSWINNAIIYELQDKDWDWQAISKNSKIIFDLNLIHILIPKSDVDWNAIIDNPQTHLSSEILSSLTENISLNTKAWNTISRHSNLKLEELNSEDKAVFAWNFVDKYKDKWNWKQLVKSKKININDIKVLERYEKFLDWEQISTSNYFKPSVNILQTFFHRFNWDAISRNVSLTYETLSAFKDFLDWDYISKNKNIEFTKELIYEYHHYWVWHELIKNFSVKSNHDLNQYVLSLIDANPLLELIINLHNQCSSWKGYVYHYTHLSNAIKILKEEKIKSRKTAKQFNNSAGNVWKSNSRPRKYARFYFRPKTPNQFHNEGLGNYGNSFWEGMDNPKCPIPVFFQINLYEFLKLDINKLKISNGNMQKRSTRFNTISNILSVFNFDDVFHDTWYEKSEREKIKNAREQEFLVEKEVDLSQFLVNGIKIIVPTEHAHSLILNSQIPDKFKNSLKVYDSLLDNKNSFVEIENRESLSISYSGHYHSLSLRLFVKTQEIDFHKFIKGNIMNHPKKMANYYSLRFKNSLTIDKAIGLKYTVVLEDNQPYSSDNKQDFLIYSNEEDVLTLLENHTKVYQSNEF